MEKINEKKSKNRKVEKKSNFEKKNLKKKQKKKLGKKERGKALWITAVIHSAFGCGETVISPHPLVILVT